MYVRQLQLTDFRSWEHLDVSLAPGVNVLIGANGNGKTNLVEALGYMATLGSHRVASDTPLVRHDRSRAVVRVVVVHDERELVVELEINPGKSNRARLNRGPVIKPRDVLGGLRTVLFAPEDLALVRGDPSERRRFLDELLVNRAPRYAGIRSEYDRVLKQRNALLKSAGSKSSNAESTLAAWDGHLAHYGAQLLEGRMALVADLAPHVTEAYAEVAGSAGGPVASVRYRGSIDEASRQDAADSGDNAHRLDAARLNEALLAELERMRPRELERGISMVGPHRDDLELMLGPTVAKGYASHGESWSFALVLRLASYRLLTEDGGEPVLVLDDVFAELDVRRRARLAEIAVAAEQVLITAAVLEDVPAELRKARFDVEGGEVRRVEDAR